ncbi:hypothetical protein AX17_002806 [Amanita inopinata Kibby_2008]|nr:hypothetical protein AX17_002806 [Amanita inopinata Kibby_2008]
MRTFLASGVSAMSMSMSMSMMMMPQFQPQSGVGTTVLETVQAQAQAVGSHSNSSASATATKTPLPPPPDPVKASVAHLLTRAYSLPCSTAAQAFMQLVQPTSRFQVALDALLPLLDSGALADGSGEDDGNLAELPQRILVAYILFSMYAPYPIVVNPFKSLLLVTFIQERNKAIKVANEGGVCTNEQLVWVLWKILKGDGNDIGPYTPSTLARSPLPPKLRASNLILDDGVYNTMFDLEDSVFSYFQSQNGHGFKSASSDPSQEKSRDSLTPGNDHATNTSSRTPITTTKNAKIIEDDTQKERIAHGMKLLLSARERVLSLSEQRLLIPVVPDLSASHMVTSSDLAPLAALNPQITHLLVVAMLNDTSTDAEYLYPYLETLSCLPPVRSTFDLMGRLIQDTSSIGLAGYSTVADLVRMEILGRFIHESINWLDHAEMEEREGLVSVDRFAQGVQNLCRFFNSLVKLSVVDPGSDVDSAEMAHFSLRNARFEEANALYRVLASGRF